jgi:tyrosinase
MGVRKNYRNLTDVERQRFIQGLSHLKATGLIDQNASLHSRHFFHNIHVSAHFLPWHREFLRRFEAALQAFHPEITIPYWNSTVDRSPSDPLWANEFLGQFDQAWQLGRALGSATLPTPQQVDSNQQATTYDAFWPELETAIHNPPHRWVGGVMASTASPGDPVFYLHHCWIDLLWARWQYAHPNAPFVSSGPGMGVNDPMMEWPNRRPADVLDHYALGYQYDIEPPPPPPRAASEPMGYVGDVARVVYRGVDDHIHELYLTDQWHHFDMTGVPGAVPAVGNPMGYFAQVPRVVYRGQDGRLHELAIYPETGGWGDFDMTGVPGAVPPAGDPMGYVAQVPRVVYRGQDGRLHELAIYPETGGWGDFDMTGVPGAVPPAGDPIGYLAQVPRVVYRSVDGHIHELAIYPETGGWGDFVMTAIQA